MVRGLRDVRRAASRMLTASGSIPSLSLPETRRDRGLGDDPSIPFFASWDARGVEQSIQGIQRDSQSSAALGGRQVSLHNCLLVGSLFPCGATGHMLLMLEA